MKTHAIESFSDFRITSTFCLIINRLDIVDENYGWLILSEGKVFERYTEKLIQEIEHDEKYDIYLELLAELEKEGKSRMGERILTRIINDLTTEQLQRIVSRGVLSKLVESLPPEKLHSVMSGDTLVQFIQNLPPEELRRIRDVLNDADGSDNSG